MNIRNDERGAVLFYVLLAVGLLAALSYAVLQTTRGGVNNLTGQQIRLHASEIINYSNAIANAVGEIRISGTPETSLCFDDPSWPGGIDYSHGGCSDNDNKIFHIQGGGIIWQEAASDAMDASATPDNLWRISGSDHVTDIGHCADSADCAELLLTVDELNKSVCEQINDLLGINSMGTETFMALTLFQGTYSDGQTIGSTGGSPIKAQKAACIYMSVDDEYLFYRVLQAR